jgi:hypothetical protein
MGSCFESHDLVFKHLYIPGAADVDFRFGLQFFDRIMNIFMRRPYGHFDQQEYFIFHDAKGCRRSRIR